MKARHKRLIAILVGLLFLSAAAALVLNAFQSNLVFFFTPTQVAGGEAPRGTVFRVGGMVKEGSLLRDSEKGYFVVTDTQKDIVVKYRGMLPDLFKEGSGVVAQGQLNAQGEFVASEVLAKHDENYMPPEAAEAMKKAQGGDPSYGKTVQGAKP
jgi:cytochrome c-type biogenesis protein CcmE